MTELKNTDLIHIDPLFLLSHDLKTPVNTILSSIQLIKMKSNEDDSNKPFYDYIETNSYRLLRMISNLIDIQSSDKELNLRLIDYLEFLNEFIKDVLTCVKKKTFSIELKSDLENCIFLTDEGKLKKIISNLISNSIKYCDEGCKINITINKDNDYIYTTIEDNGPGISEETIRMLFDSNVSISNKENDRDGLKMGLSVTKKLCLMLDGDIEFNEQKKDGASFTFRLPLKSTDEIIIRQQSTGGYSTTDLKIEMSDLL